eukprot:10175397-Prorocentrum_lima.AAC.1
MQVASSAAMLCHLAMSLGSVRPVQIELQMDNLGRVFWGLHIKQLTTSLVATLSILEPVSAEQ